MQRSSAILVLVAGMIASQACGGGDGDSSTTGTTPSSLPLCSGQTYDVSGRWERFPIRVYIEEPELARRGYSAQRIGQLVDLYMRGINSWAVATNSQIGTTTRITDPSQSDLNVVFRNNTGNTVWDSSEGGFIRHATILFDVDRWEQFSDRDHRHVNGIAHEMGHVLGVGSQHPTIPGSLMINEVEQLQYEAPQTVDVQSMLKKYGFCR